MKKRIILLILALLLLPGILPVSAEETTEGTAGETSEVTTEGTTAPTEAGRDPGYCGDAIQWRFENGVLTLSGTGRTDDFYQGTPWADHKNDIHTLILSGSITYVGAYAFSNYDSLRTINFGSALQEVGQGAFYSCDGLTSVTLLQSFICFGPESFQSCRNLTAFHCNGVCPHFRLNCLRDTYGIIYYPASRPWTLEDIIALEDAFHGRIEFLASDGSDPYDSDISPTRPDDSSPGVTPTAAPTTPPAEKPTEPPTEVPTETPTEAPATEASDPTEAPTEETTEPTEAPTTVPPTTEVPGSEAPAETASSPAAPPETVPPAPQAQEPTRVPWYFLVIYVPAGIALALLIPVWLLIAAWGKAHKKER